MRAKAVSAHPLYGECAGDRDGAAFLFRLDESKGTGKGYDRLIVDMNRNGDLTDDPVVERAVLPGERKGTAPDQQLWGPIQAPERQKIAGGRPVYFAETYMFNRDLLRVGQTKPEYNLLIGQLRMKAGWYLDTTAELNGVKRKMGVYDADSDLRLGEVPQPVTRTNRGEQVWYFTDGDKLLLDADGSGTFDNDVFQSESCAFGPIVYLGPVPYKVALAADNTSLRVEAWTEALAEVALVPHGDAVRSVTLAWEQPDGSWRLIRAGTADGKAKVPPGNYRLYACDLLGKTIMREQVMASGYQRELQKPVRVAAGKGNSLPCGPPLEIKIAAEKAKPGRLGLLFNEPSSSKEESESELSIRANVVGAGGEVYSTYLRKDKFWGRLSKPTFTIVDAQGKKLKDGNLEFG